MIRFFLTLSCLLFASPAMALPFSAIRHNNRGVELLKKNHSHQAKQELIKSLGKNPLQPEAHMNLGLALEKLGQLKQAFGEDIFAARMARNPQLRYQALFNAAEVQSQLQNIPLAIQLYQQALNLNPQSIPAKTNIELLLRQQAGGKGQNKNQKSKGQNKNNKNGKSNSKGKQQNKSNNSSSKDQSQNQGQQQQQQPPQFKGKNLTPEQVRQILEELKNQEQKVRARVMEEGHHQEAPNGKNW